MGVSNYRTDWKLRFRLTWADPAPKYWAVGVAEELRRAPGITATVNGEDEDEVNIEVLVDNDALDIARESAKGLIHAKLGSFDSERLGVQFLSSSDAKFRPR